MPTSAQVAICNLTCDARKNAASAIAAMIAGAKSPLKSALNKVRRWLRNEVTQAIFDLLSKVTHWEAITADTGREFGSNQAIAAILNIDFSFTQPYASWERGNNENANRLFRQFPHQESIIVYSDRSERTVHNGSSGPHPAKAH